MSKDLNKAKEFVKELQDRGLIYDFCKGDEQKLAELLAEGKATYLGIDPTANFLHLGHYLAISIAKRFIKEGYRIVFVIGNFTAQVGDPSFRNKKRSFLDKEDVFNNASFMRDSIEKILLQAEYTEGYEFLFNYSFWSPLGDNASTAILSFINNLCGKVKINELINKDFLKNRKEDGLTLAESLYPVLQAYDFLYLWGNKNVGIQIGGKDQFTNILYGLDFIEYSQLGKQVNAMGITFPLLEDEKGNKLGKSDGNAIDLFKREFQLYQLLKNADDSLVERYLKMLTFKDLNVIQEWLDEGKKSAQDRLAFAVCSDIYGVDLAQKFESLSASLFAGNFSKFTLEDLKYLEQWIPTRELIGDEEISLFELFHDMQLVTSKGNFHELLKSKGIYIFGKDSERLKEITSNLILSKIDCEHHFESGSGEKLFVLFVRKGKKDYGMLKFKCFVRGNNLLLSK